MSSRRALLVVLVLIAVGAAGAYVGGLLDFGDEPAEVALPQPVPQASYDLASALENLEGTTGAAFSVTMSVVDPTLGRKPVRMRGRGMFNCEGDLRMDVNYAPVVRRAFGDASLEELGLARRDLVGEILGTGDELYVRLPVLQRLYPSARPWVRSVYGDERASALELVTRDDPDCGDFIPYLEYGLPEAGADETLITDLGETTVHGAETTHYVLSVSPAEIAAQFAVSLEDLDRALRLLGGSAFDIDVWIDREGLIRRVSYHDVWPGEQGDPPTEARFVLDFFDYGLTFNAKRPPPRKVMDLQAFRRLVARAA